VICDTDPDEISRFLDDSGMTMPPRDHTAPS
jgi:hypothetical protein